MTGSWTALDKRPNIQQQWYDTSYYWHWFKVLSEEWSGGNRTVTENSRVRNNSSCLLIPLSLFRSVSILTHIVLFQMVFVVDEITWPTLNKERERETHHQAWSSSRLTRPRFAFSRLWWLLWREFWWLLCGKLRVAELSRLRRSHRGTHVPWGVKMEDRF